MDSKALTRKDFITLTLTLIGSTAVAASCSDDNTSTNNSGAGGTTANNTGAGGTTGAAGTSAQAGTTGQGGSGGSGTAVTCADPLAETQLPDTNGHVHSVTVPASTLLARSNQTITTSPAGGPAHMHNITLTTADLATLAGGGSVTVTSTATLSHMHQFMVSCH